jgi:hypothetical protein
VTATSAVKLDANDVRTAMSKQALDSKAVQAALLRLLLDCAGLYEGLKCRATG